MAVYKRAGSKYWHVRLQWNGRRIQRRTHATTQRQARQVEVGLRAMLARGESLAPVVTFPLSEDISQRP